MTFKRIKKWYRYIYSAVFYAEIAAEKERRFDLFIVEIAAAKIREEIDSEILQAIYEKVYTDAEEAMAANKLWIGDLPKFFGKPAAIKSENRVIKMNVQGEYT